MLLMCDQLALSDTFSFSFSSWFVFLFSYEKCLADLYMYIAIRDISKKKLKNWLNCENKKNNWKNQIKKKTD